MYNSVFIVIRPFLLYSFLLLSTLFVSRLGLTLWQLDRIDSGQSFITLIVNGLRVDLSVVGYLLILPALIHSLVVTWGKLSEVWLKSLKVLFWCSFISVLFFELVTPAFILEYGFRPNRLFIEYLVYPSEVIKMLLNGHLITLVIVIVLLAVLGKFFWRVIDSMFVVNNNVGHYRILPAFFASILLVLVLFSCARGTVGHRPINPALVYFSNDPLVNSLTLNSIYSVAYAYKQLGNEKNAAKMYGKMSAAKVIDVIRQETGLDALSFKSQKQPSFNHRIPSYSGAPKNLVIILEESLGAQFVASLGGLPLTPGIDRLSSEGWKFEHLYATGTRSVRGIEAVITGFTPTPARAVVKLDKSQTDFFTIASLLKSNQYSTQFIYGGESHFDNMKSFFLGNGFDDIVDFDDIERPKFVGSWGASDEDLFDQADKELEKLHQLNKPFFSLIFSSSNHDPFEIPSGVVEAIEYNAEQLALYDDKERARHLAVQYADYALAQFIDKAKTKSYWHDTIFLIVADHDARVLGKDLVPIKHFHIPGLILNSNVKGIVDDRIVSQIDLGPTLLSLIGITNNSPMLGHDLTSPSAGGRAMMQYADNFAYIKGDEVVVLRPQKQPLSFVYDIANDKLTKSKPNKKLEEIALAHSLWGSLAYEKLWYQSDNSELSKSTKAADITD